MKTTQIENALKQEILLDKFGFNSYIELEEEFNYYEGSSTGHAKLSYDAMEYFKSNRDKKISCAFAEWMYEKYSVFGAGHPDLTTEELYEIWNKE